MNKITVIVEESNGQTTISRYELSDDSFIQIADRLYGPPYGSSDILARAEKAYRFKPEVIKNRRRPLP